MLQPFHEWTDDVSTVTDPRINEAFIIYEKLHDAIDKSMTEAAELGLPNRKAIVEALSEAKKTLSIH